jgi:hypothetical protein
MKRVWLLPATVVLAVALLAPIETSAGRLRYATPDTPVAFTYPAVRIWHPRAGIKHVHRHVTKRAYVARHARVRHPSRRALRTGPYGCQPPHLSYAYPPTGYTPLPYEFGPWCAAIVSRY